MDGIKIRPPTEIKTARGVENINTDILQASFVTLIVGKPGCGKSHLLREFILNEDLYFKKFSLILFITPSKFEDSEIVLDERNHKYFLDVEWLFGKLNRYKDFIIETEGIEHPVKNVLIILDDVIAEIKKKENDYKLVQLLYNRRHFLGDRFVVSYFITAQKYQMCPSKVRSVLTSIVAFPLMRMDWRKLQDECIYDSVDKRFLNKLICNVDQGSFVFFYIRLDNSKIFYKFEKCINNI